MKRTSGSLKFGSGTLFATERAIGLGVYSAAGGNVTVTAQGILTWMAPASPRTMAAMFLLNPSVEMSWPVAVATPRRGCT